MAGEVHPTNIYQAPTLCLALGIVLNMAGIAPLWSSRPAGEDQSGQQWHCKTSWEHCRRDKKESASTEKELGRDAERSGNFPVRRDSIIKA